MLFLPEKVLEAVEKRFEVEGKALEELITEACLSSLTSMILRLGLNFIMMLCEKCLSEVERLLEEEDYVQASERAWGRLHKWLRLSPLRRVGSLEALGSCISNWQAC